MKRHENLYSAIVSWLFAAIAVTIGLVLKFKVLAALVGDKTDISSFENYAYIFVPVVFYIIAAFFAIVGAYSFYSDICIEKGVEVLADVTSVNEYFVGNSTEKPHFNLYAQWIDPKTKKKYKYQKKNMPTDPSAKLTDKKVLVKISAKDPKQYYIML